ncbi:MAG: hypothetical protein JOZ58_07030 [Acetobacteraceae bacterium]|nr:hypothetical protein [Acetobacteraceae bacterium]
MPDLAALRVRFSRKPSELPPVAVVLPALAMYDALLGAECMEAPVEQGRGRYRPPTAVAA